MRPHTGTPCPHTRTPAQSLMSGALAPAAPPLPRPPGLSQPVCGGVPCFMPPNAVPSELPRAHPLRTDSAHRAQRHHEATRARWCPSAARLLLRAHCGAGGCSVHELRPRAAPRFHRMPRSANESTSAAAGETDADAIRAEHERRSFAQRQHRGGVQAIRECRRHYRAELRGRERVLDGCVRHGHQDQPECGERAHDRRYPRRRAEGPAGVHRPQQDAPRRHLSRCTRVVQVSSANPNQLSSPSART